MILKVKCCFHVICDNMPPQEQGMLLLKLSRANIYPVNINIRKNELYKPNSRVLLYTRANAIDISPSGSAHAMIPDMLDV